MEFLGLGILRLGLNADYDRVQELANQHRTLRMMLGHGIFDADKDYRLQTLKDNPKLITPDITERNNTEVIRACYPLLGRDVDVDCGVDQRTVYYPLRSYPRG